MPMSQVQIQKTEDHHDSSDSPFGRLAERVKKIEERAHQLFKGRGHEHGRDVEDWLQAEREINSESTVEVVTSDTSITVVLTTPGFDASRLKVSIIPGSLVIEGKAERQETNEEEGVTVSEFSKQTILQQIPLPETADVDAATAYFHDEELRITVPLMARKGAASEESAPIAKAKTA
jgi:HSP20 family molecular chaperone IbpA